jgi:site-specific recombinase XerD
VRGWLAFLSQMPSPRGPLLHTSTVESYARSARAFCQWLVRHRNLQATPFAHLALPRLETRVFHPLAPEEWEQLLLACRSARKINVLAERATARNRAILWLLFDTGMRVSEVCRLHLSETGRPLTRNGMALLFGRLRKRSRIRRRGVNLSLLRESFALRFLQTGGEPCILQELLGYTDQATSTRYQRLSAQILARQRKEPAGDPFLRPTSRASIKQGDEETAGEPFRNETLPSLSPSGHLECYAPRRHSEQLGW